MGPGRVQGGSGSEIRSRQVQGEYRDATKDQIQRWIWGSDSGIDPGSRIQIQVQGASPGSDLFGIQIQRWILNLNPSSVSKVEHQQTQGSADTHTHIERQCVRVSPHRWCLRTVTVTAAGSVSRLWHEYLMVCLRAVFGPVMNTAPQSAQPDPYSRFRRCASCPVSLHKSMGAASLYKSVGAASLHKSMGATFLY